MERVPTAREWTSNRPSSGQRGRTLPENFVERAQPPRSAAFRARLSLFERAPQAPRSFGSGAVP